MLNPEQGGTEQAAGAYPAGLDPSLLIVDDDKAFSTRMARALEARGYAVRVAEGAEGAVREIVANPPAHLVTDLRLGDGNGLTLIEALKGKRPEARAIVLTGYGNIATAVSAMRLGAYDYLAKPADADEVHGSFADGPGSKASLPANPMSADRVRWEHIQRVYETCDRNVSETARRLGMHRRTLQRILGKRAPR